MKQQTLLAAALAVALTSTPAMALRTPQSQSARPANSVIDAVLDRKEAKDEIKRERKQAKEMRKQQHERDKEIRKADHEREKDLRKAAKKARKGY